MNGAVLGFPIEHSLSPLLHRSALEYLNIQASYTRFEVHSGDLNGFFITHGDEFDYLSLTMPLKEEALALEVRKDPLVMRIQSANTLYKRDGVWNLTSTDGSGLISALASSGIFTAHRTLVLGAGGTARAVVGALDALSQSITVMGRTSTRRESIENSVTSAEFSYIRWEDAIDVSDFDLVINTTPAGAADLLADSVRTGAAHLLFDVIYKPWPTVLASKWSDAGGRVIDGLELLIFQGIHQLQYALNRPLNETELADFVRPKLRAAIG